MSIGKYFKQITNTPDLSKSLNNVHYPGMFSLVFNGTKNGQLTRAFIAKKKLPPYKVQFHSHRYDLLITPLTDGIVHHTLIDGDELCAPAYKYRSPLNGGNGLSWHNIGYYDVKSSPMIVGATYSLSSDDIHTMSCKKDSVWIVEELGFRSETSLVVGVPFHLDGLYTVPEQFQVNDAHGVVKGLLSGLVGQFGLVDSPIGATNVL
jgi:hypothetical protein